jgi:hypothetical protein
VGLVLVLLGLAVAGATAVLLRRRSVKSRPGAFKGRVRVIEGSHDGLSREWRAGYGHWARDVLVWSSSPFLLRSRLIPIDGTDASGIHVNGPVGGTRSIVAPLITARRSRLELAAAEEDRDLALGPFAGPCDVGSLVRARFGAEEPDHRERKELTR